MDYTSVVVEQFTQIVEPGNLNYRKISQQIHYISARTGPEARPG
jgi:hypothetical protein